MANYFRITAYYHEKDICAIFDSNGRFEKLWQFSSCLVSKGFKIVEVGDEEKFADGNFERVRERDEKILLRACGKGKPVYLGNVIEVNGKRYLPDKEA